MAGTSDKAINSVRTALQLLTGAGDMTRARAMEAAALLLEVPGVGDTSARASQLAEELIDAATANRQLVRDLVATELERQLTRWGLVRGTDLEAAQRRIEALEAEVAALRTAAEQAKQPAPAAMKQAPATKTAAKKAATKRTTAKKTTATKTTAKKASTIGDHEGLIGRP
ncbi:hypothetical protein [Flexivirga caeni]|uniref:Polyhydroxyalkanoate synthesis protein PhaF n=1 Tax=Flexivirga caeni TaxID=2294115 RepID=A0A3M9LXQ2_9MICO|nr:hypothetical protein [Flexivirga caeni]RNI18080.1 hypothetical protein EFY87_18685 [Flexivirga caeni]